MEPDQGEQETTKGCNCAPEELQAKRKNGMLVELGGEASVAPLESPATVELGSPSLQLLGQGTPNPELSLLAGDKSIVTL